MVPVDGAVRARTLLLVLVLAVVPVLPVAADGHVPLQAYEGIHVDTNGFGTSVAWHGDDVIVGAPGADVVQVMRLQDGLWRTAQLLEGPPNSDFGADVAVHEGLLVVGAPREYDRDTGYGAAYVYRHASSSWKLVERVAGESRGSYDFGFSVDVHGDWVAVGAPQAYLGTQALSDQSAVHLYKVGSSVQHVQTLIQRSLLTQRWFGHDVDLHGNRLLVGAPGDLGEEELDNGGAYLFVRSGNTWTQEAIFERGTLEDAGGFGNAVALTDDEAMVCDDYSIYVTDNDRVLRVYRRSGTSWSLSQTLHDVSCDQIAAEEKRMVTVGSLRPYVHVFGPSGSRWSAMDVDVGPNPDAVALGGRAVALGDPASRSGSVYLLGRNVGPEAVASAGTPRDLDGDGVESVTLDGSKSTDGDGDEIEHAWYVDDQLLGTGATLTRELPVGTHDVLLAVWDKHLGTDVARLEVEVLPPPPPAADFSWLPAKATVEETFRFVDESTSEYGHVVAWDWDLDGDGRKDASGPSPSWTFDRSGRHDVTLTVRTDIGTEASATKRVTVQNLAPEARAGMDQIVRDEDDDGRHRVDLDGSASEDRDGEVRRYEWVRDGTRFSTSKTPSVTLGLGVHDIDLTVTDDRGAKDTDRVTILILDKRGGTGGNGTGSTGGSAPEAAFTWKPHPGPPTFAAKLTDQSSDRDGRVVMWWYDVGKDGSYEATEPNPVLSMGGYGARDVRLTVTDDGGRQSHAVRNVFLKNGAPTAVADARATEAYVGQVVVFVDNSTDPENALTKRSWDFGDGNESTEQAPGHVYAAAGTYTVTLTVTDDGGKTDEASLKVRVREVPPGVTVPAVAGSPVAEQADDSPFADEQSLVDSDGDGTPDASPDGAEDEADAGGFQATASEPRPNPAASLVDPGRPWLWLGVMALLAVLAVALWSAVRR